MLVAYSVPHRPQHHLLHPVLLHPNILMQSTEQDLDARKAGKMSRDQRSIHRLGLLQYDFRYGHAHCPDLPDLESSDVGTPQDWRFPYLRHWRLVSLTSSLNALIVAS